MRRQEDVYMRGQSCRLTRSGPRWLVDLSAMGLCDSIQTRIQPAGTRGSASRLDWSRNPVVEVPRPQVTAGHRNTRPGGFPAFHKAGKACQGYFRRGQPSVNVTAMWYPLTPHTTVWLGESPAVPGSSCLGPDAVRHQPSFWREITGHTLFHVTLHPSEYAMRVPKRGAQACMQILVKMRLGLKGESRLLPLVTAGRGW